MGRAVVNDQAGEDRANAVGRVALLPDGRRREVIGRLRSRAHAAPVVLDGDAQPDPLADPGLGAAGDDAPAGEDLVLSVGKVFAVRGQATVVLRRRARHHLVIVAEDGAHRAGMVAAGLLGLARAPSRPVVHLALGDPTSEEASVLLAAAARVRDAGVTVEHLADPAAVAGRIEAMAAGVAGPPPATRTGPPVRHLLILVEPDHLDGLRLVADDYGSQPSPLGRQLDEVLDRGPQAGTHVVGCFASMGALRSVLTARHLQGRFDHRIALQMSEDDSFAAIGTAAASRVQADGPRPVAGVLVDQAAHRSVLFKPYGPPAAEGLGPGTRLPWETSGAQEVTR